MEHAPEHLREAFVLDDQRIGCDDQNIGLVGSDDLLNFRITGSINVNVQLHTLKLFLDFSNPPGLLRTIFHDFVYKTIRIGHLQNFPDQESADSRKK